MPSDQLDGFLLRVLISIAEEQSVSRAAARLALPQSTVSAGLTRLRTLFGDPLFVRGRGVMVPTVRMKDIYPRIKLLAEEIQDLCATDTPIAVEKTNSEFHIGSLDYVSSRFIPNIVTSILRKMPGASVEVHTLSLDFDYQNALETGSLDLVIGNSGTPPEHLRLSPLFEDEIVCLVRRGNPLARKTFDQAAYLSANHLGLLPFNANQLGVIDGYLAQLGFRRNVKVVMPYFNSIPDLLSESDLVFTTCRRFAQAHLASFPLEILIPPIPFPPMRFYLLWHERTHRSDIYQALRECVAEAILQ